MREGSKIAFVMLWHITERTGGAEVQANYLAVELANRGYDVSYICQTVKAGKTGTDEIINGVRVFWVKAARKFIWTNYYTYLNCLKKVKPDVIVQRNSSPILYASNRYKEKYKAKLVWICTDNLAPFKDFFIKRYSENNSIKSVGFIKYMVFYINSLLSDKIRNLGMKGIDVGFSQNSFQREMINQNFGLETQTMISGHYPQTEDVISNNRFHDKIILWCANFGKHKRPELFIALAQSMLNTNYEFVMMGGHSDENYVKKLLEHKPENLKIIGHLPFEEALSFFNKTTILVNTSISEGFSNTYIQSWLRGVPTLAFGADPNNVIVKNTLGFNVDSIIEANKMLSYILSNEEDYRKMSEKVLRYANENHTIKIMTDHFINTLSKNS